MVDSVKEIAKKIVFFVFCLFPLFFYSESRALEKSEKNSGSLAITLEKRVKEPFEIESYKVIIDGKIVLKNLTGDKELYGTTIDGISPGTHQVLVKAVYSGSGYGIFDYHQNYKYPIRSETEIRVREGQLTNFKVIFNDNDGFLAELEKRPFISYETEQTSLTITDTGGEDMEKAFVIDEEEEPKIKGSHIKKVLVEKGVHEIIVNVVGDGFFEEIKTSRIDKPERIVIDIQGVKELLDIDKVVVRSPILDRVRVGQHPNMARVVLDVPKKKKVDYRIKKTSNGLIVHVFEEGHQHKDDLSADSKNNFSWNLMDVYVEKKDERVEILFAGMGDLGHFEGKRFKSPERIVVDIKTARESIKTNKIDVNSLLLNSLRIGQHPEGLRLVMDVPEKANVGYELKKVRAGLLLVLFETKGNLPTPVKGIKTESASGVLKELVVEKGTVEVEITLNGKGQFDKYNVKKYDQPHSIVIDLPGIKEDLKTDEINVESLIVKKVRVGYESGVTRIVADLEEGINVGYDIRPRVNGLIVSLFKKD